MHQIYYSWLPKVSRKIATLCGYLLFTQCNLRRTFALLCIQWHLISSLNMYQTWLTALKCIRYTSFWSPLYAMWIRRNSSGNNYLSRAMPIYNTHVSGGTELCLQKTNTSATRINPYVFISMFFILSIICFIPKSVNRMRTSPPTIRGSCFLFLFPLTMKLFLW